MDAKALLDRLLAVATDRQIAAETGIARGTLRRLKGGATPRREADVLAVLRGCAERRGVALEPAPAVGRPAGHPPPAPLHSGPTASRLVEADAVRKLADARLTQLRVQAEARRQLVLDRTLIPVTDFLGVTSDVASELRRMVDRMRRKVEAVAPEAGVAVEEEWMATAPRIEALLLRVEPAAEATA